jgi:dTDP-glucose pyrophosphorylase
MHGLILDGGTGTRLRPAVGDTQIRYLLALPDGGVPE